MKRLATQLILVAMVYVGLFQTDWSTIGVKLPDWITNVITIGGDAPIKTPGLHIVIFEESADRASLKPGQREAMFGTATGSLWEYAQSHCVKVNGSPEFRLIDKDSDLSKDSQGIQEAGKVPHPSVPWLIVSNAPKGGFSGPLPETAAEALAIAKKWGGQ